MLLTGFIRRIVRDKGFGFVECEDAQRSQYFFHKSAAPQWDTLTEGEYVQFEPTHGLKGPRAEQVSRLQQ